MSPMLSKMLRSGWNSGDVDFIVQLLLTEFFSVYDRIPSVIRFKNTERIFFDTPLCLTPGYNATSVTNK